MRTYITLDAADLEALRVSGARLADLRWQLHQDGLQVFATATEARQIAEHFGAIASDLEALEARA